MIDLHFHALPGIDDGPQTLGQAIELLSAASDLGVDQVVATPHVSTRYPNVSTTISRLVSVVNDALEQVPLPSRRRVRIWPGAEIAAGRVAELTDSELSALGLGGGPWLLVEPPFTEAAVGLEAIIARLHHKGHLVVLAHPERCPAFHRDPALLSRLIDAGVITSVTAGSFTGRFGRRAQTFARSLAEQGLVHNVTSDAHDLISRPPGIAAGLQAAGLVPLSEWLTELVPTAILTGADTLPPRPPVSLSLESRRWRWWRRPRRHR